ncbi:hypothetical protein HPP92_015960 [Vanilla planifolia]|uniref:Pentatricopeptide repeat-containing protein n=1 Tax=Vanilla planifolia TaxID=51239 RepID=A0A835QM60_VANPL|nr:hypothetical protein HPP92_015960 [Vanilla planifolia]
MSGGQPLPWLTLLQRCRSLVHLEQIHALCAKVGADGCNLFAGKLILLASVTVADSLDYARRVLDDFPSPDVFMFNTLIRGLAESDQPYLSLVTYLHMKRRLLAPDSFSFTFLLKAVANSRCLSAGAQLHSDAIRHGLDVHLYVGTTMVSMYSGMRMRFLCVEGVRGIAAAKCRGLERRGHRLFSLRRYGWRWSKFFLKCL